MDKALKPKVTFVIDSSKYKMPSHNPYRKYSFVEMVLIAKTHLFTTYIVIIVARNVTLFKNASLRDSLFLEVFINGFLNATKV